MRTTHGIANQVRQLLKKFKMSQVNVSKQLRFAFLGRCLRTKETQIELLLNSREMIKL